MEKVVESLGKKIEDNDKIILTISSDLNYLKNFIRETYNLDLKYESNKIFHTKNNLEEEYYVYEISKYNKEE